MDTFERVLKSDNNKVLAMLSGGKDSIAAIVMLKKNGIDVTAIHFVHQWSSDIPTNEAKRICSEYNIPLIIKDYTKQFCEAINGFKNGRPCLLCKKQMYKILLELVNDDKYGWICIGDNLNDRTTIARIKQYIDSNNLDETLSCSGYMGNEMGITLPNKMKVVRPLINMSTDDIEKFLVREKIEIKRINSTGDKYFEYHREGCPIQFADIGVELDEKLYDDLKKYNECITKFAREHGILASIHMPSTFIITIPKGYEEQAAIYLEKNGLCVDSNRNSLNLLEQKCFVGMVYELDYNILSSGAYEKIFNRFLERLELFGKKKDIIVQDKIVTCVYNDKDISFHMIFDFIMGNAQIMYTNENEINGRKDMKVFDNLILEMFRTRKYKVIC